MSKRHRLLAAVLGIGSLMVPAAALGQGRAGAAGGSGGRGRGVVAAGQRTTGFPQYTRALPSEDVLARGKSLYDANCASCHAPDARGVLEKHGPNLLRSTDVYSDVDGELVSANLAKHKPVINLPATDTSAIAGYLHSIQATMSNQGSPPGRNPVGLTYNVLVGNVIGTKYDDPKTLQNTWVSGGGGGRGGRGGGGQQATVTLANGQKVEGQLVRKDDFLIVLTLADGTRKSFARDNLIPQVEVKDPQEAHKKMLLTMDDPDNKNMHDITAYLATIK
jgi:cytochrome c oxidase cbb3-type subunit 3